MADTADIADVGIFGLGVVCPSGRPVEAPLPSELEFESCPALVGPDSPGKDLIESKIFRRAGRSQRLALTAAHLALNDCSVRPVSSDDVAVTVGTGLGALGETAAFLENMIRHAEARPKPTRFINSVHNSLATQIAISFGFGGENYTFVHGSISFESALWQGMRLLRSGRARYVLACCADELNPYLLATGLKLGWWRTEAAPLTPLRESGAAKPGTVPGEGAAAFVLGRCDDSASPGVIRIASMRARPLDCENLIEIDIRNEIDFIEQVVQESGIRMREVEFVLLGANGDSPLDHVYTDVKRKLSPLMRPGVAFGVYRQLCGEYCTASGVGLALAADTIRKGRLSPGIECVDEGGAPSSPNNVLLYNVSRTGYHSVCLVTG